LPENQHWLMTAFTNKNAEDLKSRAPTTGGDVFTLHSLGLKSLNQAFKKIAINPKKLNDNIKNILKNK